MRNKKSRFRVHKEGKRVCEMKREIKRLKTQKKKNTERKKIKREKVRDENLKTSEKIKIYRSDR